MNIGLTNGVCIIALLIAAACVTGSVAWIIAGLILCVVLAVID